jgi:hypothetical protein
LIEPVLKVEEGCNQIVITIERLSVFKVMKVIREGTLQKSRSGFTGGGGKHTEMAIHMAISTSLQRLNMVLTHDKNKY